MLNDPRFAPLKNGAAPRPVEDDFQFLKIPDDAGDPAEIAARICGFKRPPDDLWRYCDEAGAPLFYIARWNLEGVKQGGKGGKSFKPLAFVQLADGRREWTCRHWPAPRPLYGLNELANRPEAPVVLCEGEKACDAARQLLSKSVCLTWPGGTGGAKAADFSPLAGRRVILWPDADQPGHKAMAEVAATLAGLGCKLSLVDSEALASVEPFLGEETREFQPGWDAADALAQWSVADFRKRFPEFVKPLVIDPERAQMAPEVLPLDVPDDVAERYPIACLGPVLGQAAAAIARKIQVPDAIAGQSVLAAAALAAQGFRDIMLPYGQTRPISLFCLTIAGSGDRKSAADGEALWPIRKHEKRLRDEHETAMRSWSAAHAAHAAQRRKVEVDKNLDLQARTAELMALGPEPPRPLHPILSAPDPTIEGLAKAWQDAPAALGLFSAEGGQFFGGFGMSDDHKLKTASALSELWDGNGIRRMRAGDGLSIMPGRRLSSHLMAQPEAAHAFMGDDLLRGQGLHSRFLVAAPESVAGARNYRPGDPADDAAIRAYGARLLSILEAELPLVEGKRNEVEPPALVMSTEAERAWIGYFNHVEAQCGPNGNLEPIRGIACKSAEQAGRIAGVLSVVEDRRREEISEAVMLDAIDLADWYLNEALRLADQARVSGKVRAARRLLDWAKATGKPDFTLRDAMRLSPRPRTKADIESAARTLIEHGYLVEASTRPLAFRMTGGAS